MFRRRDDREIALKQFALELGCSVNALYDHRGVMDEPERERRIRAALPPTPRTLRTWEKVGLIAAIVSAVVATATLVVMLT